MKFFKISVCIAVAFLAVQCNDDVENSIEEIQEVQPQEVSEEILNKLKTIGFNVSDIPVTSTKGGVVVERDIFIPYSNLEETNFNKQAFLSLMSCQNSRDVKIKNDLGDNAAGKALNAAILRWNSINSSILNIRTVTSGQDITIRLDGGRLATNTYGQGSFPSSGKPGATIDINLDASASVINNGGVLTQAQWVNVITHEIGHNIGLLHIEQASFGTQIATTVTDDPRSIMRIDTRDIVGLTRLTTNDRTAVRTMYSEFNNSLCK